MIYSIYKATFENNKIYFGITSRELKARILEHKSLAKRKKGNFFHRALNKYGNCKWEVIYQSKCINDIKNKEIFTNAIKKYFDENPEMRSKLVKDWYADSKNKDYAKIRRLNSIKKYGNKAGKPKKPLILIKDNIILKFESLSEASKAIKLSVGSLSNLVNGKIKISKGYEIISGEIK